MIYFLFTKILNMNSFTCEWSTLRYVNFLFTRENDLSILVYFKLEKFSTNLSIRFQPNNI